MRISDWSSDVCSSDLGYYNAVITGGLPACAGFQSATTEGTFDSTYLSCDVPFAGGDAGPEAAAFAAGSNNSTGTSTLTGTFINGDRKSVVQGKSVSVRVDLGGRRIIKKKNKIE